MSSDFSTDVAKHSKLFADVLDWMASVSALRAHFLNESNAKMLLHLETVMKKPTIPTGALMAACQHNHCLDVLTINALLQCGADPTTEAFSVPSLLQQVHSAGGGDDDDANQDGQFKTFPLCAAARSPSTASLQALLAHDAVDVNQFTSDLGRTALHVACCEGRLNAVRMLLEHGGIQVNQCTTSRGQTALFFACHFGECNWERTQPGPQQPFHPFACH